MENFIKQNQVNFDTKNEFLSKFYHLLSILEEKTATSK